MSSPGEPLSSQGCRQTAPPGSRQCLQDEETTGTAPMPGTLSEPPSPTSRAPDALRTDRLRASESQHPPCSVCSQELNFREIPLPSPPDRPAKPPLHSPSAGDTAHFCGHVIERRSFQLSDPLPQGRRESHLPFPPRAPCLHQERGHPPQNSRTG